MKNWEYDRRSAIVGAIVGFVLGLVIACVMFMMAGFVIGTSNDYSIYQHNSSTLVAVVSFLIAVPGTSAMGFFIGGSPFIRQ